MRTSNRKWTSEEDSTLISMVKANPQNLKKAFLDAADELGRSAGACTNRWYKISKLYKDNPDAVCFAVFSKERYGINRKNCKIASSVSTNRTIWSSIMNFIRRLR